MGLFENLGRKVEEFKQEANDSARDASHACTACEATFYADYEECPECGSDSVVALS